MIISDINISLTRSFKRDGVSIGGSLITEMDRNEPKWSNNGPKWRHNEPKWTEMEMLPPGSLHL